MSRYLAHLLLDTLRLAPAPDQARLADRWAAPDVAANAGAIAEWIAWEQGEQWLLRRLADTGALSRAPARLIESLRIAARRDAKAGLAVDAETAHVLQLLASNDVPCVLIKGPARRAAKTLFPMADARRTSDVDVLIRRADAERAWRLLISAGYSPLYPFDPSVAPPGESELWWKSLHHLRPVARPGRAAVELHLSTSGGLTPDVAWKRNTSANKQLSWQGLVVAVPSATELVWHGLTHGLIYGNKPQGPSAWALRYWLDVASIAAEGDVDWHVVGERLVGAELPDSCTALRWLSAATQLAGTSPPDFIAPPSTFPLLQLIAWRLGVFSRPRLGRAWQEKLLDEGTRAEVGLPVAPLVSGRAWPIHVRRRIATVIARAGYLAWRRLSG